MNTERVENARRSAQERQEAGKRAGRDQHRI
jgi:hypothetical protein